MPPPNLQPKQPTLPPIGKLFCSKADLGSFCTPSWSVVTKRGLEPFKRTRQSRAKPLKGPRPAALRAEGVLHRGLRRVGQGGAGGGAADPAARAHSAGEAGRFAGGTQGTQGMSICDFSTSNHQTFPLEKPPNSEHGLGPHQLRSRFPCLRAFGSSSQGSSACRNINRSVLVGFLDLCGGLSLFFNVCMSHV